MLSPLLYEQWSGLFKIEQPVTLCYAYMKEKLDVLIMIFTMRINI